MYDDGRGVTQDYAHAVHWYRLSADQGEAHAQFNLGVMYEKGWGVPQDYVLVHMWYNLATASMPPGKNRDTAASHRDNVERKMTPDQVAEAQRLARERKPKWP